MKFTPVFFLFLFPVLAFGQSTDICDIIQIKNCRGVTKQMRRNTFQTAPTTSTAASFNPANVSFDRGMGLEVLYQPKNPLLYSVISGTGKMGGALISGSLDNSFFGNRIPELKEEIVSRSEDDKQYKNKKFSAVIGGKLFAQKNYGLDVGVIVKRHSEIKDINVGGGLSGRFYFLHFGISAYKDDAWLDLTKINSSTGLPYSSEFGKESYEESFTVQTYTVGTRIKGFAFDFGKINSKLDFFGNKPTEISLYSASYVHGNFLLTAAMRKEHSEAPVYDEDTKSFKFEEDKNELYYGLQYSVNQHIIFGLNYNYFLLKEYSVSATLFI